MCNPVSARWAADTMNQMRLAALYDIHGNLPALEAVLEDVRAAQVDGIVIGGDIVPGPMPRETLARILDVGVPVHGIHGNGELAVLAQVGDPDPGAVAYWGTVSGAPPPEPVRDVLRWTAGQLEPEHRCLLASWPKTLRVDVDTLGGVLFCHGTPRSETDVFTRLTPEDPLLPLFAGLDTALVICGHTHMQFDRTIGTTRVVNAGSVGMPFGRTGADWLLLGPRVELRRTTYDLAKAADRVRATTYPGAQEFAAKSILDPPSEAQMLDAFTRLCF
jgi:predicted phosphodiesterase